MLMDTQASTYAAQVGFISIFAEGRQAGRQEGRERQRYLTSWLMLLSQLAAFSFPIVRPQAQNSFAFVYLLTVHISF